MEHKVTREGMFETNSSSTHSLVIRGGKFKPFSNIQTDLGIVTIYCGEFGWGPSKHTDAATKASYCLTYAKTCVKNPEPLLRMLKKALGRVFTKCSICFISKPTIIQIFDAEDCYEESNWGYIDHQSEEVGAQAFVDEQTLYDFIFNPESVLIIDNDNGDY